MYQSEEKGSHRRLGRRTTNLKLSRQRSNAGTGGRAERTAPKGVRRAQWTTAAAAVMLVLAPCDGRARGRQPWSVGRIPAVSIHRYSDRLFGRCVTPATTSLLSLTRTQHCPPFRHKSVHRRHHDVPAINTSRRRITHADPPSGYSAQERRGSMVEYTVPTSYQGQSDGDDGLIIDRLRPDPAWSTRAS